MGLPVASFPEGVPPLMAVDLPHPQAFVLPLGGHRPGGRSSPCRPQIRGPDVSPVGLTREIGSLETVKRRPLSRSSGRAFVAASFTGP